MPGSCDCGFHFHASARCRSWLPPEKLDSAFAALSILAHECSSEPEPPLSPSSTRGHMPTLLLNRLHVALNLELYPYLKVKYSPAELHELCIAYLEVATRLCCFVVCVCSRP